MLINDKQTLQLYWPISLTFEWHLLEDKISQAESEFLLPFLGQEFYEELLDITSPTDKQAQLLTTLRRSLAGYACWLWMPFGNVIVDEQGIRAQHDATTKPAFEWQVKELRLAAIRQGHSSAEAALRMLETLPADGDDDDFETWRTEMQSNVKSLFVYSASVFNSSLAYKIPRSTFLQLAPLIQEVEESYIQAAIGPGLFGKLRQDLTAEEPKYRDIMPILRRAVCAKVLEQGFSSLMLFITELGITSYETANGSGSINRDIQPSNVMIDQLITRCTQTYNSNITLLTDTIIKRISEERFSDFKAEVYKDDNSTVPNQNSTPGYYIGL